MRCAICGANNRIAAEKMAPGKVPVCGRCKHALSERPGPVTVTDASFAEEVERSALPVLVDMWAPWCGPCRMIAPAIEELAGEFAGRMRVAKMNVDDNPATSAKFGIQSIPALLLFKDGREVDRILGAQPKGEILRWVQRIL
jgi:thioredoxin 2